jgi:inosose dehydratase
MELGISPINWINDDRKDLGNFYELETVLNDMQSLGFKGTEMGRKYPRDPKQLKPLLSRHDLQLTGAWKTVQFSSGWNPERDFSEFQQHVHFLSEMGTKYAVICDGGGSLHWDARGHQQTIEKYDDHAWSRLVDGLHQAATYAQNFDIHLVYHAHYGTGVETPEEIDRLMELTDPKFVSLLADTGHIYVGGGIPEEVIRKHIHRIKYMHLKDVRPEVLTEVRSQGLLFLDAVQMGMFTTPGDGTINFPEVFRILHQNNYQGWMIVEAEQDPLQAEPVSYAKKTKQYLELLIQLRNTT